LDDSLRRRATDVARLAVSAPALLRTPGTLESPLSGHQLSVEVLDREGAIVARSLSLGAKLLPRTPAVGTAERGATGFADAELGGPAEVTELAGTLNGMLEALAAARERERRFLADASHELRTPLTSLRGNVEYVARHGADPEVIADLEGDAERLGRLVEDLL